MVPPVPCSRTYFAVKHPIYSKFHFERNPHKNQLKRSQTGTLAKESGFAIGCTPKLGAYEAVLRKRLKEEGYDEGFDEGYQHHLLQQITKKVKAGKPLEQIAEEVEEPVDAIRELYDKIKIGSDTTK